MYNRYDKGLTLSSRNRCREYHPMAAVDSLTLFEEIVSSNVAEGGEWEPPRSLAPGVTSPFISASAGGQLSLFSSTDSTDGGGRVSTLLEGFPSGETMGSYFSSVFAISVEATA